MDTKQVSLGEAKAHLSELTELASAGETVIITKHGKAVGRLSAPEKPRKPIDLEALRRLTADMPYQPEGAGQFMRRYRESERY
ncbi:prevent-host-death protein [Thiohalorhabdus denitrificans]|uniref:Antitoxin n=1 Tax=Thiohalorhabdus denitrificans TaxID=381306 RepID=A0A0P9ECI2_9GAMM|nr:type II toxin-antitoxin system prevent-host-death family antitoxin [Thiohalorhabdus denitrificans]KPV39950.1 prevent-host-death protein [Thiohalorhabdus denitrificans]SCY09555.1 prevent-host-death family protein [Thiohalorhabdus denitrificans]